MFHLPRLSNRVSAVDRDRWRAQTRAIGATILRFVVSAIGLILVIVTLATWLNPNPFGPTSPLRVGMEDSGRTITLKVNNHLDIVLDDYTTQGHGWELVTANYAVVSIPHPSYTRNWSGGGRTWFAVTADQPARSQITIIHDQVPNAPPIKPFSIEVVVR
jgi:hypothetical protein